MADLPQIEIERRAHRRVPTSIPIKVANYTQGAPLDQLVFQPHECRNASVGGISYFTSSPPRHAQIVVALARLRRDRPAVQYILAHIRKVCRVTDGKYFVCCQLVRTLQ